MGTWNYGPFDNDAAREAVQRLLDGQFRMDQFRFNVGERPLDSREAEVVVALAALLRGNCPRGVDCEALTRTLTLDDRRWIRRKLREVLNSEDSELYEQWADAGELEQWLTETGKLLQS